MNSSRTANKMRAQIGKFSGVISSGLPKVAARFVGEMVYGIQASQSVMLSEIGRALEEPIAIKKTEERLSRQLMRGGLGEVVQDNLLREAGMRVTSDMLLVVDLSDIMKKYAKKMEYLARVYDGSTGELENGYSLCEIVGVRLGSERLVPLYQSLWSTEAPEFMSENDEILKAVYAVFEASKGRGIYVVDSGGDRDNLFLPFIDRGVRFLIRLKGDRHLLCGREKKSALDLARECECPYTEVIMRKGRGKKDTAYEISFGYCKVKLPEREKELYLLVVKGLGEEPLMVLTTEELRRNRKVLYRMVQSYFARWSIEETIRFLKQCYHLENVRLLTYESLKNLMPIVLAVSYFTAAIVDTNLRLQTIASTLFSIAKRIFGIPDFRLYALSDALKKLFTRHPGKFTPAPTETGGQLYFEGIFQ